MEKNGQVFMVASGKGGVGKSSLTVCIGRELARLGQRVLLVEMEPGLGVFDLMLGISRSVCDLSDLLSGEASLDEAALPVPGQEGLWAVLSPINGEERYDAGEFARRIEEFRQQFDCILIETPPGFGCCFAAAMAACDTALLVVTPDRLCLRRTREISDRLDERPAVEQRLLINRMDKKSFLQKRPLMDLDEAIDTVGARLLGVVPEDSDLPYRLSDGTALSDIDPARLAIRRIARRLMGETAPLFI